MLEHNGYYITVYTDISLFEKWNLLNVSYLDYPCIIYWTRIHELLSKIRHKQVDPFFDRLYISIHLEKLYRWTFRGKKKRKKKKNLRTRLLVPDSFVSFPFSSLKSGKNWDVGGSLLNNLRWVFTTIFLNVFPSFLLYLSL